ncbi:MAG TPA: class I SAM-dependent methyltransferase [Solirubrobacterales bacterium]|nr:class I SAM-dependent methyltransferase [Solirubrobacterales bacterium]
MRAGLGSEAATGRGGDPVAWHDAENGGFTADLPLFERLAAERDGRIADLGAGTGRVSLQLAAAGHAVTAVDFEQTLLEALRRRAADRGLEVGTACADVRSLRVDERFSLVLAPMQLLHILGGATGRRRMLASVRRHLEPGGRLCAVVVAEPLPVGSGRPEPVPDVREADGWTHSSLPVEVTIAPGTLTMVRLRQLVAPDGTLTESRHEVHLDRFSLAELDRDSDAAGLWIVGCDRLPSTLEYEDSVAIMMEARDG